MSWLSDLIEQWRRPKPPTPPVPPPPLPPGVPGDYSKIATLDFRTDNNNRGVVCATAGVIAHVQRFLRDGMNVPVSQQFISLKADLSDKKPKPNRGPITDNHGTSSPRLLWEMLHTHGVCPMSMCPDELVAVPTAEMDAAAQPYRVGGLLGLAEIPNYAAAKVHMTANRGDCVLLTSSSMESYSLIGFDAQGNGIWVDYQTSLKARVQHLNDQQSDALWRRMTENQRNGSPADFMVLVRTR